MPIFRLWLPPALEIPRVRLYAAGHAVSVLGTWVQSAALSWLVYRLTGSVAMLGLMGFLLQIPFLVLGPFTGRIVDRMPKLPLLIGIDLALSTVALASATMAFSVLHRPSQTCAALAYMRQVANGVASNSPVMLPVRRNARGSVSPSCSDALMAACPRVRT